MEDQRTLAERLTEEELAIFDLLTQPHIERSDKDKEAIKKVARDLLETLKREKLVLDWRKKQQARAQVQYRLFWTDCPASTRKSCTHKSA